MFIHTNQPLITSFYIKKGLILRVRLKLFHIFRNKSTQHDTMLRYYADMGPETIRQLYEVYKADFEIFGYELPVALLHPYG